MERPLAAASADSDADEVAEEPIFQIMELPVEVRAKIFQMVNQRSVPVLRLVCQQWRREIDQFYEFSVNVYDTSSKLQNIRHLRCRECIIWKLTRMDEGESLLDHPGYLKTIKIYGPIQATLLRNLISSAINLEHLTVTRRANYPKILNLKDTPALANLTRLKYLRLNSEEHLLLSRRRAIPIPAGELTLPMMDCYFPALKHFEILKRFPHWNSLDIVSLILKFVSRHARTLETLELDLIPLSTLHYPGSDTEESMDDEAQENVNRDGRRLLNRFETDLNPATINLALLCELQLQKCCLTTKGSNRDVLIWKSILENQASLKELRFDWLCNDPRVEVEVIARVTGFPWVFFKAPISNCAVTLVTVELSSLSMMAKDNLPTQSLQRILPFDLRTFRTCTKLKNLILRCRENHGRVDPNEDAEDEDFPQTEPEEVLLMMNGSDLPDSIETLEIRSFPMLTSDIRGIIWKCRQLKKLFLKECGKTQSLGVTADIIKEMGSLTHLKFLEVIGFNDSTPHNRRELELAFRALGLPYEGQETWLEFDHGLAHEALKPLSDPTNTLA